MNSKMKKAAVIAAIVIAAVVQVHAEEWIVKEQETRASSRGKKPGRQPNRKPGSKNRKSSLYRRGNQMGRLIRPVGQHRVQGLSLRQ